VPNRTLIVFYTNTIKAHTQKLVIHYTAHNLIIDRADHWIAFATELFRATKAATQSQSMILIDPLQQS